MAEPPRAFVCGHPIAHSRSPLIHAFWLETLGIAGSYEAIDTPPDDFAKFLGDIGRHGFAGGNITIPHKETAFALVNTADAATRAIGAVNTVWLEGGRLCGSNTDWTGFAANLDERAGGWDIGKVSVILGAGGAARAILHALVERGFSDIRIVNRTRSRAEALARGFASPSVSVSVHEWSGVQEVLAGADLLVNTTSLGMDGGEAEIPDLARLPASAIVTDAVYVPLETPLLKAARCRALATVDGLGMLLHQAVPGFEKWFGVRPQVTDELRDLVIADMERWR